MLPGRTDNAVKNRFHATERAKSRSKGDDQFNAQADQEFFDKLKKLHPDVDFDLLCEQHASAMLNGGHTTDQSSVDNARTSSITGSGSSISLVIFLFGTHRLSPFVILVCWYNTTVLWRLSKYYCFNCCTPTFIYTFHNQMPPRAMALVREEIIRITTTNAPG